MEHPFLESANLKDKSLDDLQKGISDVLAKLNFAQRSGNSALRYQLQMVLESYRNAYYTKTNEMLKKQNIDSKIDIKKR
jgi:hypothetical protein